MKKSFLTRLSGTALAVLLAVSPVSAETFYLCSRASAHGIHEFPEVEVYQPRSSGVLGSRFAASAVPQGGELGFDGGGLDVPFGAPSLPIVPEVKGTGRARPIEEALQERKLYKALQAYADLEEAGTVTGRDHYLAAYIWLILQRSDLAGPLLTKAKRARGVSPTGWPTIKALQARVKEAQRLMPPLVSPHPSGDEQIKTFAANSTAFTRPLFAALPAFTAVGKKIFGDDIPDAQLIIFSARQTYERFFAAAFGRPVTVSWQDGTGTINTVVFSETGRNGRVTRPPGTPETIGNVLHEFGHSWWHTYLSENHDVLVSSQNLPPWLDEGMAEYAAWMRDQTYLDSRKGYIENRVRAGITAPSFEVLSSHDGFYGRNADLNYWLAALLVRDILGPAATGAQLIDDLLDNIAAGETEAAVTAATGKDPRAAYRELVARFWEAGS